MDEEAREGGLREIRSTPQTEPRLKTRAKVRIRVQSGEHLGIEVISELRDELGFDWQLLIEQRQVVLQLRVLGDNDTLPLVVRMPAAYVKRTASARGKGALRWALGGVKCGGAPHELRPAGTSKHLHRVHHGELSPLAALGVVHLHARWRGVGGGTVIHRQSDQGRGERRNFQPMSRVVVS